MGKLVRILCLIIIGHVIPSFPTLLAQYDGSYDDIYFLRSFSPKSEALGRSGVAVLDNALSLQTNSSLVGHMSGYALTYGYSNPFYYATDGTFQFIGLTAGIGRRMAIGISDAKLQLNDSEYNRLQTISMIYNPMQSTAISVDARRFSTRFPMTIGTQNTDAEQWYMNLNASYVKSYSVAFLTNATVIGGIRVENVLNNELNISNSRIELPQIATLGFSNLMTVYERNEQNLIKYIQLTLIAEYSDVLNSEYNTRFSAGSELDINGYLKARVGYLSHSMDDLGNALNKDAIREPTYGLGFVIPVSTLLGLNTNIYLECDVSRMQQPIFTKSDNPDIGMFTLISTSLKIQL
jgi:hypothetical protein